MEVSNNQKSSEDTDVLIPKDSKDLFVALATQIKIEIKIVNGLHGVDGPHVLRHVEVEFKKEVEVNAIIMLKTGEIDVLALTKKQDHVMKENVQVYIFGSKFLTLWLKIYQYIFISEICTAENTNWGCCSVSQKCDEFQGDFDKV